MLTHPRLLLMHKIQTTMVNTSFRSSTALVDSDQTQDLIKPISPVVVQTQLVISLQLKTDASKQQLVSA